LIKKRTFARSTRKARRYRQQNHDKNWTR